RIKKSLLAMACLLAAGAYWGIPSQAEETVASSFQRASDSRERAIFNHKRKEHARGSCNTCHNVTPSQIEVVAFPGHGTCIGCHNFANEFFKRGVTFCGVCHEGGPTSKMRSALFNFKEKTGRTRALLGSDFGIDFSHVAHRKPLPQDFVIRPIGLQGTSDLKLTAGEVARCTDCHQRIPNSKAGEREIGIEKGHPTCFQCHGMRPAT